MKVRNLLGGSLSLVLLCAAQSVAVQRPNSAPTGSPPSVEHIPTHDLVAEEKRDLTGEIARIDPINNTVVIKDEKTGKHLAFHLDKRTKLRADKQSEFDGRKNISLADFKAGHLVKLTYRASDGKPLELRLRANKT